MFGEIAMVKKLAVCDNCDYKGVADVIEMEDSDDKYWDCPNCKKRHINEGTVI
jgi:DNA-directed RNA polymerase subunit RPC12/RpoP